jgi:hypothetical protein
MLFLEALAKLRKTNISLAVYLPSIIPAVLIENLGTDWTNIHGIFY